MTTDTAPAAPAASAPASAPAPAPAAAAPAPAPAVETPPAAAPASAPAPAAAAPAPAASNDTPPASEPPPGAPEKYEFTQVEGIKLGDEVLAGYGDAVRELNLPQDKAQGLIAKVAPLIAKQQADAFKATVEGWETAAKADKEIGGDKFAENLSLAKKGMDAYFPADFVKLLNDTGLGNHPDMIRGLMKIGKTVSQDSFVSGGNGSGAQRDAASVLYGNRS